MYTPRVSMPPEEGTKIRAKAKERLDRVRDDLIELSHRIHAHPELKFEEEQASSWLAALLSDNGFAVEHGAIELPTVFVASAGSGPLHVAPRMRWASVIAL